MSSDNRNLYVSLLVLSVLVAAGIAYFTQNKISAPQQVTTHEIGALQQVTEEFDLTTRGSQVQTRTPEIKVLYKEDRQLLLQLDMQRYKHAAFEITFHEKPMEGWCVDIGDSPSNDGWRGDAGDFSNDAEVQIAGKTGGLAIYGNDYTKDAPVDSEHAIFLEERGFAREKVTLEIGNEWVAWDNHHGNKGSMKSEYFYALQGQYDAEHNGPNDYLVYAAFNGVVAGNSDRIGDCVEHLKVTLTK